MTEKQHDEKPKQLILENFFPYRLSVLAQDVSQSVAEIYTGRFQLRRAEWRVVAALGQHQPMSAKSITAHTCMDKMPVSRAITVLKERGLVVQEVDSRDRRYSQLSLTEEGMALYEEIVPGVLEREHALLSEFTEEELTLLDQIIERLHDRTAALQAADED